jgi:hypothetical protein
MVYSLRKRTSESEVDHEAIKSMRYTKRSYQVLAQENTVQHC